MERNYKQIIENWLKNYHTYKDIKIPSYKELYACMQDEIFRGSIDYSKDKLSPTNLISSNTEDVAIRLYEVKIEIERMENVIKIIDNASKELSDIEKKVIELRYMNKKKCGNKYYNYKWWEIGYKVERHEDVCRRIGKRAIDKMEQICFKK